ncbi:MAG: hypothetical protein MPK06_02600 [Alphaproteobacteria bacterium]|nr:hypothetical protein [Alphaproteobacteria bacterium]MDA8004473.1 hypothetical protein [Alphaproteobacteria bacterium]MDA8005417.1 hypothetical protein [Alphaproteobacteria bacterium]MDA8012560.1 hypothetical protein [Alphaproteobacteria bacterium]
MTDKKPPRDPKGHSHEDLPFSQRHGGEPVPTPYQQGTLSKDFRLDVFIGLADSLVAMSFFQMRDFMVNYVRYYLRKESESVEVRYTFEGVSNQTFSIASSHNWDADEVHSLARKFLGHAEEILALDREGFFSPDIFSSPNEHTPPGTIPDRTGFNKCMDFLEFLCNDEFCESAGLNDTIKESLDKHREGYYLAESNGRYRIKPIGSAEEDDMMQANVAGVEQSDWQEVKKHLGAASQNLKNRDFDGAVRESVHAVESAVRDLTGESNFQDAVKSLHLHGALEASLVRLYGYASDGPRHGQPDSKKRPPITEAEAMLCWSVAVSVTHYLWRKHGQKP